MDSLVAYQMLYKSSGRTPSAEEIEGLYRAVGVSADLAKVNALLKKVEGRTLEEMIEEGSKKMQSVAVAAAPSAVAPSAKEAPKEEEEEEEEDSGSMDLFG